MGYYAAAAEAAQRAAMFRAQAAAREADLLRKATSAQDRLQAAGQAYEQGNVRVATRILLAVVRSEAPDPMRGEARNRLGKLAGEADQKFQEIEGAFQAERAELSPGEDSYATRWPELVRGVFRKYDELTDDYGAVPKAGREIENKVARKRRLPEYAEVLNEPESLALWQLGQEHEQQDHACCAYWVYQEAQRLLPAPSARRAQARLEVLQQDPQLQAAAEACRALQECHKKYRAAEQILARDPERARQLLTQIVNKAPADSALFQAASRQLESLRP